MSLNDLPIKPCENGGEFIAQEYLKERKALVSVDSLMGFTRRWNPLYMLDTDHGRFRNKTTRESFKRVIMNTFNAEKTWKCIQELEKSGFCGHGPKGSCEAMHIMMPFPFLKAFLAAQKFGVSVDIALIQLYGGLGVLHGYGEDYRDSCGCGEENC